MSNCWHKVIVIRISRNILMDKSLLVAKLFMTLIIFASNKNLENENDQKYFIRGYIDRFDNLDNQVNIIDYKTNKEKHRYNIILI